MTRHVATNAIAGMPLRRKLAALLCALAASAFAGTASAAAICTISAVGPAFGVYDPSSSTPTTANGSVEATCTWTSGGATNLNLVATFSAGNSGSLPARYMRSGTNRLNYNLYFDSTYTTIRGDGTAGTQAGQASVRVSRGQRTATATGTIYGMIPAGQDAVPGLYSDTIVVTLLY